MSAIYRLSLNGAILTPHTMALVLTTVMSTLHYLPKVSDWTYETTQREDDDQLIIKLRGKPVAEISGIGHAHLHSGSVHLCEGDDDQAQDHTQSLGIPEGARRPQPPSVPELLNRHVGIEPQEPKP